MQEIILPETDLEEDCLVETETSIVVIGANGSGKTRLGTWIEFDSPQKDKVHRISAQKSLTMSNDTRPTSIEHAKKMLYYGAYHDTYDYERSGLSYKKGNRWSNKPEISLLSDFNHLLTYLFSENYEKILEFKQKAQNTSERVEPPITKLDKIVQIWESVINHRKLEVSSGSIFTYPAENKDFMYSASEMSDGERVVFYLIGECLAAPEDGIIIIDEPELHLHKSIQSRLWDKIEEERKDCLFVYLTHDLDFASSRVGTEKICLKNYDGGNFNWFRVSENDSIPEDIYLEILGSRDPILFVEGEIGSYDEELYSLIYQDFTIKPMGSCTKVIESTKSFNEMNNLHNLKCYGIIDRDYREQDHIDSYEEKNIFFPKVAEVENLFLLEEVLYAVADQFCDPEPEKMVKEIKDFIFEEFDRFKSNFAAEASSAKLNYILNGFDGKVGDISSLKSNFDQLIEDIDVDEYYNRKIRLAEEIIDSRNYNKLLEVFNHKGIVNQVGKFYGIKPNLYTKKVKNIINYGEADIIEVIKDYLPDLGI